MNDYCHILKHHLSQNVLFLLLRRPFQTCSWFESTHTHFVFTSDHFLWIRKSIDYGWFGLRCVMPAFISRLHQSSRVNMVNVNIFIRILFASNETNITYKSCKSSFRI